MTTGDPSAHQTSSQRAKSRTTPKKAGSVAAGEPRVGSVRSGTVKKRPSGAPAPEGEADVLERLNKLAEAKRPDDTARSEPIMLPAIIEADPSVPLPAPSARQIAKASLVGVRQSPAPVDAANRGAVIGDASTDLDTMPVVFAPDLVPERVEPIRTELVTVAPPPPPTQAIPAAVVGDEIDESAGLLPQRPLQRPVTFRRGRPRVRRVTRVVRHVDPWSVFKVALVFNAIVFLVCLTSGVLLWNVAHATGTIDNVENFFEQFGWSTFEFNGGALYHNAWLAGLFGALFLTGAAVLLATVFNLITDLVGGIRLSVLEEEVVARSSMHTATQVSRAPGPVEL